MKPRILNTARLSFPLATALATLLTVSFLGAQTTYTWDPSNVTGTPTPTLDWFTGGSNPLGVWTGAAVPVSASNNTIRFFADITTSLPNTAPATQTVNLNNGGSAFQLGTLQLNGFGSTTSGASLTMTLQGDAMNFSGTTGTITFDGRKNTVPATDPVVAYNVNNNIQLGTASSVSALTINGNGDGSAPSTTTYNIGGAISELQTGGGSIVKSGTNTVNVTGALSITGGVTVGAGTLNLSNSTNAASSFTVNGGTLNVTSSAISASSFSVNGGTLILTGNHNPASGSMTVNSGGILRIGNNTATQFGPAGVYSSNISTGTGGTLQLWSTSAQTLSGVISGAGGILKAYAGTLTLSGANTYTGKSQFVPQTASGFQVNVSSFNSVVGGAANSSLGAPTTVANGTIDVGSGTAQAGVTLNYTGAGETTDRVLNIVWNGNSSHTISASGSGLLKFDSAFTLTPSAGSGNLILSGNGNGEITQGLSRIQSSGLSKAGNGTWTLGGSGNFTSPTTISAGTLRLSSATALQNSPFSTASVAGGPAAGLRIDTTTLTLGGLTGTNALDGRFTTALGGPSNATAKGGYSGLTALTLNNAANTTSIYSGGIVDGANGMTLTKIGAGTQFLTGTIGYTGLTSVNGGTLGTNGTYSGAVAVGTGATLSLGASAGAFGTVTISDASASALTLNGGILQMDVSTASSDLVAVTGTTVLDGINTVLLNPTSGVAAGTYDLVTHAATTGSGSVVFANGTTTLGDATLAVNAGSIQMTVGAGGLNNSVWVGTTATWDSGTNWSRNGVAAQAFSAGDFVTIDDTGSNAATITSAGTVSPAALTVNNSTKAFTISATIGGTGTPLVKLGTNTLNLSSLSNAYTGGTVINSGTVNITGTSNSNVDSVLGNASGGITLNGGRLQATSTNISGARIVTVNGTGSSMLVNKNNNFTTTGKLTGAGTLTTLDAGGNGTLSTYRFNSTANDFTGRLIGTNTIINVNSFADSTNNIVLNDGAVFTYGTGATGAASLTNRVIEFAGTTGATITNANTTAANTLAIGGGLLVTSAGNKTLTLGGVNTGNNTFGLVTNGPSSTISLNKIEAGTWSLNGANTHTGGTTLTAGTLRINNATALGAGSFIIAGNGTFDNVTGSPLSVANPLTMSGGSPTFAGSSNMTITGPVTISGITAGSTRTITVSANTLTLTNDITESVAGLGLTKGGPGTMTLSSVNSSFTGLVSLAGGTTNVAKLANIGSNSSLGAGNASYTVRLNGGTMNYNGAGGDTTNRTIELAASAIINNNSTTGAIAFTAANVAQTGTASARTLTLGGSYTGGANSFGSIIGNSGTSPNLTSLVKNGNSTWILSGANTYTGTTTISGGTLALGANDVLPNASNVSIAAATLDVDTRTDTAGTLDVTAAATINLGTGGALAFANSSAVDWTGGSLNITGTYTPTSIRFGTTSGGLTTGQLAVISVNGSGAGTYTLDVDGYLVSSGGDAIPPTLTSITDNVTGGPVDISAPVTYTVTFNEDMDASTVTAADFSNAGTATASIGAPTETTPGVFTVVVTPSTSGTLQLQIPISAVLTDVAGNPLDNDPALLDDTTITVRTPYATWAAGFLPGADVSNPSLNFDSDGLTNLQEYAFGTDPTASSGGSIEWTPGSPVGAVTQRGTPVVIEESGMYYAVYGRRVDYATADVTYTQQFSPGLSVWGDFATAPTVIATDGTIEAVKVPFPGLFDFGSGPEKATFFRMEVSQ